MYPIYRLFKHTCFILLRSLQDTNQPYIKYTENALLIYDNDDNISNNDVIIIIVIIIVIINDNDDNFKNEEKVQL